jgi:hypothetical protein
MLFSWFKGLARPSFPRGDRARGDRFRPLLEGLEERVTPSSTDLAITRADTTPNPVASGGAVTYIFDVINNGPNDTTTNPTFTAHLQTGMTNITATSNLPGPTPTVVGTTVTYISPILTIGTGFEITIKGNAPTVTSNTQLVATASISAAAGDSDPNTANNNVSIFSIITPGQPTAINKYVVSLYRNLELREPELQGFNYWVNLLNQGMSRPTVVFEFLHLPEYETGLIQQFYHTIFGPQRDADQAGLSSYENFLNNGGTIDQVVVSMVTSSEFINGPGHGTNDGLLQALYLAVLSRPIDSQAEQFFNQQLASGITKTQVAQFEVGGSESAMMEVTIDYQQYLNRNPDQNGLNFFSSLLEYNGYVTSRGQSDPTSVVLMFVTSAEYDSLHS